MPGKLVKAANGFLYFHWTDGRRSRRKSTKTGDNAEALRRIAGWLVAREPMKAIDEPGRAAAAVFLRKKRSRKALRIGAPSASAGSAASEPPTTLEPATAILTVAVLFAAYRERHVLKYCVSVVHTDVAWKILKPHFGALTPSAIDNDAAERFAAARRKAGVGDSTIRRDLVRLLAMLNWAAHPKRRLIDKLDVPTFDLPAAGAPRDRWLTTEEIGRLLQAARQRREAQRSDSGPRQDPTRLSSLERFLWIGLQTGARQQAIMDLTWDRVDFETGMIDFNVPGRRVTRKRRVAVPMSSALRGVLQEAYQQRRGPHVLDARSRMWMQIQLCAKTAGLTGVSPHVLRHTAATHMARRGVPLFHIAGVLGNTVGMVEKVYAKHAPAALAEAVEKIGAPMLARPPEPVSQTPPPNPELPRALPRPGRPVRTPRFRPPRPRRGAPRQTPG